MAWKKPEGTSKERRDPAPDKAFLIIEGLRQNNLRNLTLAIPHNRITVVVGLSGSGKSSLAFDTLFAEGRWRFIESLSTYTRLFLERMDRPDLDAIHNIRPAIAVEQKNPVRTSRSTVGTATEINDYLRLVFARAGRLHCPECGTETVSHTPQSAAASLIKDASNSRVVIGFTLDDAKTAMVRAAEELSKKGFYRVRFQGQVYNLAEEDLPYGIEGGLDVITDRLIVKEETAGRLAEAVETAFREGDGKAWAETGTGKRMSFHSALQCPGCATQTPKPTPFSLSFNHPVGACPECKGFGNLLTYDAEKIIPDPAKSLRSGAIEPWTKPAYRWWHEELLKHAANHELDLDLDKPFAELSQRERDIVFNGTDTFDGINGFFAYLETKKYKLHVKVFTSRYKGQAVCPSCNGTRLRKAALSTKLGGRNIAEVSAMPVKRCLAFIDALVLAAAETKIAGEALRQLRRKLEFLKETGLGYITLDRQTKTLSGGEFQRISLATQLGSMLTGVLYILDEPSIGLHPVDVDMLTAQIKRLAAGGNTVVTVEHDPAVIRAADHIVELGPGAGERGGNLVYCGPAKTFLAEAKTLTADYLTGRKFIHTPRWRRGGSGQFITLAGATGFNLKGVDVDIPLRTLTCVSGVSGSGKSTLIVDTLYNILAERFKTPGRARPQPYRSIKGLGHISGVKLVDQSPIGRTPRSNPLTYIGGFDEIRKLYAGMPAARTAGLTPRHFSFNVPGGRCEACKGEGVTTLEMYFLPDVYIKCAACNGRRYKHEVLGVRYKGRSIHDCLAMTFEEAAAVFPKEPSLQRRFDIIRDVGLGYLRLGQSGLTLSGGEAQRLKVARELSEGLKTETVYILDEPTTGLHPDDTKRLLSVLGRLVDNGSTVIVIEHNMDFLKCADHIIDIGPGGGEAGGRVIAAGTPEDVAADARSATGRYLKAYLR